MAVTLKRRVLILVAAAIGVAGTAALFVALDADPWAVVVGALLGGGFASTQAWLLLGLQATSRSVEAQRHAQAGEARARKASRDQLERLTKRLDSEYPTRKDLANMERRLVHATADDEAQLEAWTQLMQLLPPPMPMPRTWGLSFRIS